MVLCFSMGNESQSSLHLLIKFAYSIFGSNNDQIKLNVDIVYIFMKFEIRNFFVNFFLVTFSLLAFFVRSVRSLRSVRTMGPISLISPIGAVGPERPEGAGSPESGVWSPTDERRRTEDCKEWEPPSNPSLKGRERKGDEAN